MSDIVEVKRKIYGKNTFGNVVDVKFSQLVPNDSNILLTPLATTSSFFSDYDNLFYTIAPSGSQYSHLELVNRSSDYIGLSIENMLAEIANLREENVALKTQLYTLTNQSK